MWHQLVSFGIRYTYVLSILIELTWASRVECRVGRGEVNVYILRAVVL